MGSNSVNFIDPEIIPWLGLVPTASSGGVQYFASSDPSRSLPIWCLCHRRVVPPAIANQEKCLDIDIRPTQCTYRTIPSIFTRPSTHFPLWHSLEISGQPRSSAWWTNMPTILGLRELDHSLSYFRRALFWTWAYDIGPIFRVSYRPCLEVEELKKDTRIWSSHIFLLHPPSTVDPPDTSNIRKYRRVLRMYRNGQSSNGRIKNKSHDPA